MLLIAIGKDDLRRIDSPIDPEFGIVPENSPLMVG
jgi:hypothetical protein